MISCLSLRPATPPWALSSVLQWPRPQLAKGEACNKKQAAARLSLAVFALPPQLRPGCSAPPYLQPFTARHPWNTHRTVRIHPLEIPVSSASSRYKYKKTLLGPEDGVWVCATSLAHLGGLPTSRLHGAQEDRGAPKPRQLFLYVAYLGLAAPRASGMPRA